MRTWLLRLLRVPCGAFGGQMPSGNTRWCLKRFGHSDSCMYDFVRQPLDEVRRRARGWR